MNYGTLLKIVIGLQMMTLGFGVDIQRRVTRLETIYELQKTSAPAMDQKLLEKNRSVIPAAVN